MIHTDELDPSKGLFSQLRALHPIKCGSFIEGKRVVETGWKMRGNYNAPVYRLDGDPFHEYREATSGV
jgi:hypothetical protein